jgi:hypothetical protein
MPRWVRRGLESIEVGDGWAMAWGRGIGTIGCVDREFVRGESAEENKVMLSSICP